MDFQDTQLFGALIGGGIGVVGALGVALITQIYTTRRHRERLRHEKAQEIRDRRTSALTDLCLLLEEQKAALNDLRDCISDPDKPTGYDAWQILDEKGYRHKSWWATDVSAREAIDEYAKKSHELSSFLHNHEDDIGHLWTGDVPALSHSLHSTIEQKIEAALTLLDAATEEVINLTSEINDIQVR